MWTLYFDKIYLINLPRRKDRLASASAELMKHNIPFEVFAAIDNGNKDAGYEGDGAHGIWCTLKLIFQEAVKNHWGRILIFEDDVKFVADPNYYLAEMIAQLDENTCWEIFYLGPNTHQPLIRVQPNILRAEKCRGLHAVAYSYEGMTRALGHMNIYFQPVDMLFESRLQPAGNCFAAFPLLATQGNGYSDIEKKEVQNDYIIERFKKHTNHLK